MLSTLEPGISLKVVKIKVKLIKKLNFETCRELYTL